MHTGFLEKAGYTINRNNKIVELNRRCEARTTMTLVFVIHSHDRLIIS